MSGEFGRVLFGYRDGLEVEGLRGRMLVLVPGVGAGQPNGAGPHRNSQYRTHQLLIFPLHDM
ncbi:hypothetical protein C5E43_09995 [Nocardia cyriacigeorgica]|nr:hypothetical protein C5B73_09990 [Nocardia cyriacigeorgica]PPJ12783.1 hypothetical protein C5E43_09995 [Nocardia cyriacigeorgica]